MFCTITAYTISKHFETKKHLSRQTETSEYFIYRANFMESCLAFPIIFCCCCLVVTFETYSQISE